MTEPAKTVVPDDTDWTEEERDEFAEARSHEASKTAYDLGKAVGQAGLLINGGAATAVLALLTKDKVDPTLVKYVPWCLALYAVGVASSATMLFCTMKLADHWNYFWYHFSYTGDQASAREHESVAGYWQNGVNACWIGAIGSFVLASLALAIAMTCSR